MMIHVVTIFVYQRQTMQVRKKHIKDNDNVFLSHKSSNFAKTKYIFKFHVAGKSLWFGFIVKVALATSRTTVSTMNTAIPPMH
jgi:hypothetical protein